MSRLTTMLSRVGAKFDRAYGPGGLRIVEIGNVSFEFEDDGTLVYVKVTPVPKSAIESGS